MDSTTGSWNSFSLHDNTCSHEVEILRLKVQLAQLQLQLSQAPTAVPLFQSNSLSDASVALPPTFDGNRAQFRSWLCHMSNYINIRQHCYPNDAARIGLYISLLREDAMVWASPFIEKKHPI